MASELHGGIRGEIQQLCMPAAAALRRTTATIECPKSMVGRVIGKNGETIKALQTYTGSLIQVNQVDNPCQITISGSPQSLSLAVSMVADIVKGTFKGFALLRQVASPSTMPRSYTSFPQQQLPIPQPVYAPGYGLIPPSQVRCEEWQSMQRRGRRGRACVLPRPAQRVGQAGQCRSCLVLPRPCAACL